MARTSLKLNRYLQLPVGYKREGDRQTLQLPFRLESRANYRGHTRSKSHRRAIREQRNVTRMLCQSRMRRPRGPFRFMLVRVAPRTLDPNENLPMCFKSVADGIADWLNVDDRSGLLCEYDQEKAPTPNTYGCLIIMEPA